MTLFHWGDLLLFILRKGMVRIIQFLSTVLVFGPILYQEAENKRGKPCKFSETSQRCGESPMETYPLRLVYLK